MSDERAPVVRVDALETFVELLTRVEDDGSSDAFYSSLCEAVCRLTSMDRAVIFRYDEARRRVRAAGAYGLDLDRFTHAHVTVESAPIARQALVEDRVIEMDAEAVAREVPERFRDLLDDATLVCCPLSAGGRWSGVILADRRPRRPLSDEERDLLWTLGKIVRAGRGGPPRDVPAGARARQLQERIDLAREVHEGVIQRCSACCWWSRATRRCPREARERVTVELQAALRDLRRALQRPLGRTRARDADDAASTRSRGCATRIPTSGSCSRRGSEDAGRPARARAARPVRAGRGGAQRAQARAADAGRGDAARQEGAWVMEVCNDGVRRPRAHDLRDGPAARRARGAAGRRARRVRRARAGHLARAAGGAA